jgi:hypothetical protein
LVEDHIERYGYVLTVGDLIRTLAVEATDSPPRHDLHLPSAPGASSEGLAQVR